MSQSGTWHRGCSYCEVDRQQTLHDQQVAWAAFELGGWSNVSIVRHAAVLLSRNSHSEAADSAADDRIWSLCHSGCSGSAVARSDNLLFENYRRAIKQCNAGVSMPWFDSSAVNSQTGRYALTPHIVCDGKCEKVNENHKQITFWISEKYGTEMFKFRHNFFVFTVYPQLLLPLFYPKIQYSRFRENVNYFALTLWLWVFIEQTLQANAYFATVLIWVLYFTFSFFYSEIWIMSVVLV